MTKEKKDPVQFPSYYPLSTPQEGAGGQTGSWRHRRPLLDFEECSQCLLCYIYCPEGAIDKNEMEIDLNYCKGCGICAVECPKSAIVMIKEVK